MANQLNAYVAQLYAREAMRMVKKRMGMIAHVHRGYDEDFKKAEKGNTVNIRVPSEITIQPGGTGTVQDLKTRNIAVVVDQFDEAKFGITDVEKATSNPKLMEEHLTPAINALVRKINKALVALHKDVPHAHDILTTDTDDETILEAKRKAREVIGDLLDEQGQVFLAGDSYFEKALGKIGYNLKDISGEAAKASIFGLTPFLDQSLIEDVHLGGTAVTGADQVGALFAGAALHATQIAVEALAAAETLKKGDTLTIAGNSQRYAITEDVTLSGTGTGTISITPPLVQAHNAADAVTLEKDSATNHAGSYTPNLIYHRLAFCLATVALPEENGMGAVMSTVTDPESGLSLRVRFSYQDGPAQTVCTVDAIWGVKTIDPNKAIKLRRNAA